MDYEKKSYYYDYSPTKVSYGYYQTICDYCGKDFTRRKDSRNEIEIYLDIYSCPFCGGGNRTEKEKRKTPGCVEYSYVPEYSMGLEIEFYIPNKQDDEQYIRFMSEYLDKKFGFDGRSPIVKERRSDVIYGSSVKECIDLFIKELNTALFEIESCGGKLKKYKMIGFSIITFGIHVSFGGDFIFSEVVKILNKYKIKDIIRKYKVDLIRDHENRLEYRGYGSSKKDILRLRKALEEIRIIQ